jgi:hypothetical protein
MSKSTIAATDVSKETNVAALPVDAGVAFWRASIRASIISTFVKCVDTLIPLILDYLVPTHVQLPPFNLTRDRGRLVYINGGYMHPALYSVTTLQVLPGCEDLKRNELLLVVQPYHRDWRQLVHMDDSRQREVESVLGYNRFVRSVRRSFPPGNIFYEDSGRHQDAWSTMSEDQRRPFMKQLLSPNLPPPARENPDVAGEEQVSAVTERTSDPSAVSIWGVDRCQLSAADTLRLAAWHAKSSDRAIQAQNEIEIKQMTAIPVTSKSVRYQTRIVVHSRHAQDCNGECCVDPSHGTMLSYPPTHVSAPLPVPNPITFDWLSNPKWSVSQQ